MHPSKDRLDKLLVDKGLAPTRTRAQALVMAGRVRVDGKRADKAGQPVNVDSCLEISGEEVQWVSRGAHKLLKALESFDIDPAGMTCMDVGASTGGFTEVLLSRGAARVTAVDVGYGQLAWKLRSDPRVIVMERTNARLLCREQFAEPMDLIVVDASFISLRLLLPVLRVLLAPCGEMILLVKPQFEAGKGRIGKGGVVRSPEIHRQVLEEFCAFVASLDGIELAGLTWSPIKGPSGNIEFLAHLATRRNIENLPSAELPGLVEKVVGEATRNLSPGREKPAGEKENDR